MEALRAKAQSLWRRYIALTWVSLLLLVPIGLMAHAFRLDTVWLWIFLALASFLVASRRSLIPADPSESSPGIDRLAREGFWEIVIILVVLGIVIFTRMPSWNQALFFLAGYVSLSLLGIFVLLRRKSQFTRTCEAFVALTAGPFFVAWIVVSLLYLGANWLEGGSGQIDRADMAEIRKDREERIQDWKGPRVAVLLSGGGYRAAVTHAGLLWILDQAEIPVHILSCVSGGSITGSSYASGWKPEEFRDYLIRKRPGLPNDFFNFFQAIRQILYPTWGSGETYAAHFRRVYFQDRLLKDTGPPVLILNTTDYKSGERTAFWPGQLDLQEIAPLVAASGAFPGALDPVLVNGKRYMDGGVVENLGVEGLRQYLESAKPQPSFPRILIISDMSADPREARMFFKPSVLDMAMQAQQVSYQSLHDWIYELYTGGEYDRNSRKPLSQPYRAPAQVLSPGLEGEVAVFVLNPASQAERWRFRGEEKSIIKMVAGLLTLSELEPEEVRAAFWAGAKLARDYLPELCRAAGIEPVPEVALPPLPEVPE